MKKEELRQDPVIELIIRFVEHLKNKKNIVFQSMVALLIIIGGIGYTNHMRKLTIENAKNLSGLAQNNYVNGQSEIALSQFNTILSEYPNTIAGMHSIVYILKNAIENNNMDTLSELINNNVSVKNQNIRPFLLHMEADAKMQVNNYSEAIELYNQAISKINNNVSVKNQNIRPFILHMEADARMQANNYSEAIELYNQAISKTINIDYKDRFRISLAYAYISNNMMSKAKTTIDKILNNNSATYKNKNAAEEISSYLKFMDGI